MPRDVSTRWNSTYDMIKFAIEYCAALDKITADHDMKLRQFELSNEDWDMATELGKALQVCLSFLSLLEHCIEPSKISDFQTRHSLLLA
jgi:hypothetical protein